jgi:hypothetical protein
MIRVGDRVKEFLSSWSMNDRIDALKAQRMIQGERKHGPLNLKTDRRDFIQEGIEELIDFLNYLEMAMFQGRLSFCKWAMIDRDVRFLVWRLEGKEDDERLFHSRGARGTLRGKSENDLSACRERRD